MTPSKHHVARQRASAVAVSLLVVVGALVVGAVGAGAAPETSALDASATQTAIGLQRSTVQLRTVTAELRDAEAGVSGTQASMNVTLGLIAVNDAELDAIEARVKARGAEAYVRSGNALAPLDVDGAGAFSSARQYAAAATRVDTDDLAHLRDVDAHLHDELADKTKQHDDAVASRDALADEHSRLDAQVSEAQSRLRAAGAIPIMGSAALSGPQMAAWYRSTGVTPSLSAGTTIDDIAALYIDEGASEGVRGDFAFAQAVIETGSFTVAAGNNYSGIGVCDSCTGGYGFATPRDGVRAQIQLLRNYADPDSRADRLAHPPSPDLYGADAAKAAHLYDTFFLKGRAPLWNLMGDGNWATDPVYAPKVIGVYNQMVAFANAHPEVS